jgi:putative ABC transport system permease protein
VLPLSARYVVALGGIVIGGTMTGATLAGRNLLHGLRREREVVEAWLSLGATPRQAVRDIARRATFEALVPALDQTRTTGLVTLPGAFVGALLGGADPLQAARFQLVVLGALLAAETVVASVVTYLLGAPARLPDPL